MYKLKAIILQSALKHGVSEKDIMSALSTRFKIKHYKKYTEKRIALGFDTKRNIIEIAYEDDLFKVVVFHARRTHNPKTVLQ